MRIAFVLYKYFPYGGLQRDFLKVAHKLAACGLGIRVYTMRWEGPQPEGWDIRIQRPKAFTGPRKNSRFQRWFLRDLERDPASLVIGFNKMPGLDLYYAADGCFQAKAMERSFFYRLTCRYRHFYAAEQAVFGVSSKTHIFMISKAASALFKKYYKTPDTRFTFLPPGIERDRIAPKNALKMRQKFRALLNISDDERLLLLIGSGFKTKGLDRAIRAFVSLPMPIREKSYFFVIGQDNARSYIRYAKLHNVTSRVRFFNGRDDIPHFLQAGDLLLHPAYAENAGIVLLEALAGGLQLICTDVCGYAHHVAESGAGAVLASPFKQQVLNKTVLNMLTDGQQYLRRERAIAYAGQTDLYSLYDKMTAEILAFCKE